MEAESKPEQPAKPRRSKWRGRLIDAALILAVLVGMRAWQQRNLPSGPSPELSGRTLDGTTLALADLKGQPVAVHFWATWCSVCAMEKGSIQSLASDRKVITIAAESGDAAKVASYLKANGLSFPVVLDQEGKLAHRFGVQGFPTTLFLDRNGVIRFAEVGYTSELGMRLRLWLAGLWG